MKIKNLAGLPENLALAASVLLLFLAMFLLPFWSVEEYSRMTHTTSQLAGQHMPHAGLMNAAFVMTGGACLWQAQRKFKQSLFRRSVLSMFSASLILVAVFRHRPISPALPYSAFADRMHSVFATGTGMTFVLFAVMTAFSTRDRQQRILAFALAGVASFLSMAMAIWPEAAGIWQRLIFLSTFTWLTWLLVGLPVAGKKSG